MLAAWAAAGANDKKGQELLAEALRLSPGSSLAGMAFQRMEGVPGDPAPSTKRLLGSTKRLLEIEKQYKRPVFHKAQLGFNNNVQYQGATYHVQTEDSGIDRPTSLLTSLPTGPRHQEQ